MVAAALKSPLVLIAAALPPLLVMGYFAVVNFQWQPRAGVPSSTHDSRASASVEELHKSLAEDRRMLSVHEKDQAALRSEVIRLRKAHQEGQIGKAQVVEAEQAFVAALKRVHELRHAVTEADIAITEAVLGEKVLRMPVLPAGGFTQTAELTRFNGAFKWSIKDTPRIERFFAQTFGRNLPITALGQSHTHNRLGFDHRDAIDVGLHPDSAEGRSLIDYLRKSGIPFLAFRQAVPGAATGPHIHVGRPSARLAR
jgi:hypothetical protein